MLICFMYLDVLFVCMSVYHVCTMAYNSMKLEKQMVVDSANKSESSRRSTCAHNHWSILPGPGNYYLKRKNTNERPNVYT